MVFSNWNLPIFCGLEPNKKCVKFAALAAIQIIHIVEIGISFPKRYKEHISDANPEKLVYLKNNDLIDNRLH